MAELEAEMANVNRATEKMIIPVALKAARKIVGREIELSEKAIVDIVATKLKAVKQSKQVIVYVCPQDLNKLEANRKELVQVFEKLETLSIRPSDDVKPGGCIIETEAGIINAQLEKQWEILEKCLSIDDDIKVQTHEIKTLFPTLYPLCIGGFSRSVVDASRPFSSKQNECVTNRTIKKNTRRCY